MTTWDDETPQIVFSPQERRIAWTIAGWCIAFAVLVFAGPVPVAVPLMAWFVWFAATTPWSRYA